MTKETFSTWWTLFAQRWGKAESPQLAAFYWTELETMDDASFADAARRALRSLEFFPTVEQLEDLGGVSTGSSAIEQWEKVAGKLRYASRATLEGLDEAAKRAVRTMGGLPHIGRDESAINWRQSEFMNHYTGFAESTPEPLPEITREGRDLINRAMGGAGAKQLSGAEAPARQPAARS